MVRAARSIVLAAAVIVLAASSTSFAAERSPSGTPRQPREVPGRQGGEGRPSRGAPKGSEARLDAVKIVGSAEHPAILFFLPRAKFRLLPLRPEPDPGALILRDDKRLGEAPGS